jgi:hypothetical protein
MIASAPDSTTARRAPVIRWRIVQRVLALALIFLGIVFGWAYLQTRSAALVIPLLSGERLLVEPTAISLGQQKPRAVSERNVRIVNLTSDKVTVLGAERSCGCITMDDFPLLIPAGESREVHLKIHINRDSGEYDESVKFFTDYSEMRAFEVTVRAAVGS